jgi:hypothetical protein
MPGGPLKLPAGDAVFFAEIRRNPPATVEVVERDAHAEEPAFVDEAVDRLIARRFARVAIAPPGQEGQTAA